MQRTLLAGLVVLFGSMLVPVQPTLQATGVLQTQAQPAQAQPDTETFFGTVLKDGPNFVLSDSATKTKFTLDNPQKASRYEGMTVRVTGTLDATKNMIHVETIQRIV